jgi:hypothetical protein
VGFLGRKSVPSVAEDARKLPPSPLGIGSIGPARDSTTLRGMGILIPAGSGGETGKKTALRLLWRGVPLCLTVMVSHAREAIRLAVSLAIRGGLVRPRNGGEFPLTMLESRGGDRAFPTVWWGGGGATRAAGWVRTRRESPAP